MAFERFCREAIDLDGELLYLGEVDGQSIGQGGEDKSFALRPAWKMLNSFAPEIDRRRRSRDPDRSGIVAGEEGKESGARIFTEGKKEILQTGLFIRAGWPFLDNAGKATPVS